MDQRLASKDWRLTHLYKIRDKEKRVVPFTPNAAQADFRKKAHSRNLILKSRQLGFTTFEAIDTLDDALFTRNFDALLIAHTLDDAKDIFDRKISLAWEHFPLKQLYSLDTDRANTLKLGYGDGTFSSLAVDTSGRSGTYHRVHITEFAVVARQFPTRAEEIVGGTIPAVPTSGRVDIESTADGGSGIFYDLFWDAWNRGEPTSPVEFKAHFYNWTWEVEEIRRTAVLPVPKEFQDIQKRYKLSDRQISFYYQKWLSLGKDWSKLKENYPTTPQEAFDAPLRGVYFADQLLALRQSGRLTRVPYDASMPVHTVHDIGMDDSWSIGFYQKPSGAELRMIDFYENSDQPIEHYVRLMKDKGYVYGKHFGPHDLKVRELGTGKSRWEVAHSLGVDFQLIPNLLINDGIDAARRMTGHLWMDKERCDSFIRHLDQYGKAWDDTLGRYRDKPRHDQHSHAGDVHRYASLVEDQMIANPLRDIPWSKRPHYDASAEIWKNRPQPHA